MSKAEPENSIRNVVDACADCDVCRHLMDECCPVFPNLYRVYDRENDGGRPIGLDELRFLSEQCTLCGICPCPNIRADLIRGKTEIVQSQGLPLHARLLSDLQTYGRWGRPVSSLINRILATPHIHRTVKQIAQIHGHRDLPRLADEDFFVWAQKKGLNKRSHQPLKAAYFSGCTAGFLFPQVSRATVTVLQHSGIGVHVPLQQCCGMPTLLEGDRKTTLKRVRSNLETMLGLVEAGYQPVCTCPTCGFLMKSILKEGAFYSEAFQQSMRSNPDEIKIPCGRVGMSRIIHLKKSMFAEILKDDGYFSEFDPLKRIALSENMLDLGEYLRKLRQVEKLNRKFGRLGGRMVYFAPCHQREQGIDTPYMDLLPLIPGLQVQLVGSKMDCCGMGGSLGFKKKFYDASIRLAEPLRQKILAAKPDAILTDCLSCRLQFQHLLPYPVYHPVEIIASAYEAAGETS